MPHHRNRILNLYLILHLLQSRWHGSTAMFGGLRLLLVLLVLLVSSLTTTMAACMRRDLMLAPMPTSLGSHRRLPQRQRVPRSQTVGVLQELLALRQKTLGRLLRFPDQSRSGMRVRSLTGFGLSGRHMVTLLLP